MAKLVGPLFSVEARGSVGDKTYTTLRGVSVVKARKGPATQYSSKQVAVRARTAEITALWQSLSPSQRADWNSYASVHLCCDWTGQPKRLSGYNWFVRINAPAPLVGTGDILVPPYHPLTGYPFELSAYVESGYLYLRLPSDPDGHDATYCFDVWSTPWGSVGRKPDFHKAQRLNFWIADDYFPLTPPGGFPARCGIYARLIDRSSGYIYEWQSLDYTLEGL